VSWNNKIIVKREMKEDVPRSEEGPEGRKVEPIV
jgi:hypothetical protein